MGGKGKKTNENPAQKLILKALKIISKAFYYIGKPFYLILSYFILFLILISYITGHITRLTIDLIFKKAFKLILSPKKIKKKNVVKKKPKEEKIKITLPYLDALKILFLKLELVFAKIKGIKPPKIRIRFGLIKTIILVLFITLVITIVYIFQGIPSPKKLTERKVEVSTKIYDRNGILLYTIYKDKNRTPVSLNQVPDIVKYATLAAEDAEFYHHPGFSIRGILRALVRNYTKGELSGGSTITQQLVKNALLTPEKTLVRKIREIILAVLVEATYSKDKILEMYLNEVSYGGTAYGIEEASKTYFGKSVSQLTLAEAAFLAGLPKSPSKYSPFSETPELGLARQKDVLNLMRINGFIGEEEEKKRLKKKSPSRLKEQI